MTREQAQKLRKTYTDLIICIFCGVTKGQAFRYKYGIEPAYIRRGRHRAFLYNPLIFILLPYLDTIKIYRYAS